MTARTHFQRLIIAAMSMACAVTLYAPNLYAQDQEPKTGYWPPRLSLEDIHLNGTFSGQSFNAGTWSESGPVLRYIVRHENEGPTDLIAYNLETEKKKVLLRGERLWAKDVERLIDIESYSFSDDGRHVLIFTDTEWVWRERSKGFYYVFNFETETLTPLSDRGLGYQMFAKFSPDAERVAFVRGRDLYLVNLKTGIETQLTHDGSKGGIINGTFDWVYEEEFGLRDGWSWSPDGEKIAFFKLNEADTRDFAMTDLRNQYPQYVSFRYPKAGEANSDVKVGVVDVSSGKIGYFETGTWGDEDAASEYIARMGWTPPVAGESRVWMMKLNRDQNELDLIFASPESGKAERILTESEPTWIEVSDNKLTFLKEGEHFVWQSETRGYRHLDLYSRTGKYVAPITAGEWDVAQFYGLDESTSTAYFSAGISTPTDRQLYGIKVDLGVGDEEAKVYSPVQITKEEGVHEINMSHDLKYFIDMRSSISSPNFWELKTTNGDHLTTLEENVKLRKMLSTLDLSAPEIIQVPAANGTKLNAYLIKPRDFDASKSYPLLMYVYGGPGSQTVRNQWGSTNNSNRLLWHHYLANELNLIVASVDNRGTGARGKEFKSVTYQRLGQIEAEDQISAAKYLGDFPYINQERIGIWGWSYGGYMTLMSMLYGDGPKTFKLGVSVAPVTDWRLYDTIYTERYMSTPQSNPEGYNRGATTRYAQNLADHQKLLIIHGDFDDNVHFQNSIQMIDALQAANKQFDLMVYPGKNHSIAGGNTRLNLFTKATLYIKENL